jgi:hypothetical protein
VSSSTSVPIEALVAESATPIWYQVHAADPAATRQVATAVEAGGKAICVSTGVTPFAPGTRPKPARIDWKAIDALTRDSRLPIVIKGITTADAAATALRHNVHALIVSNYGLPGPGREPLLLTLPAIVSAVAGKVPVLVDGSFRRGTDILKALAFGATAVAVGRPVMWGLAAYGADGVQGVIEMLQTELARYMAMCGRSTLSKLDRTVLQLHGVPSARSATTPAPPSTASRPAPKGPCGGSSIRRRVLTRRKRFSTQRSRLVAVPSSSPSISRPRTTNDPRGIGTLADAAPAVDAAVRPRRRRQPRRPVPRGTACNRDASGTRGSTSTRFAAC